MISCFYGDFRFLSNFWPCEIEFEGMLYPSVEHAYQAAKTIDISERVAILKCDTPKKAKRFGKEIKIRKNWDEIKIQVMESLVRKKFKDEQLARWLNATGKHELREGNVWGDTFWGVCDGVGYNYLGKILMAIREEGRNDKENECKVSRF